jgi:penicillin-binding protein 1C
MRARRAIWLLLPPLLVAAALAFDRACPLDLSRARTLSPELQDVSGRVLNLRPAADGAVRLATGPDDVGPDVIKLLLAREDRRFWALPGVDPLALIRAAAQLVRYGRIVSGGSTIAMQVARLLEPHPRSIRGKLHDLVRAIQLEAHLGKPEILRLYLTLAPMGGNIEGVRAASLLYFGHEPAALTCSQAALLVGVLQSPSRRRPDRHPDAAWTAAARVLAVAEDTAPIVPTPIERPALPSAARYLAQNRTGVSRTTLDGDLQAGIEALAAREVGWLGADVDVAAMVVRNSDRAVLAYLGGARFWARDGQVDMVRARRSPGSALKPFIYAMAFEQGLATTETILDDRALRLADYAPRDFDRIEHGAVTAAQALRHSLNRPAVRLLAQVGAARFAARLRGAGARLRLPVGGAPSAALALGGAGISLADLTALYADLADGGVVRAPHLDAGPTAAVSGPLVSAHAAALVADILRGQPPPPGIAADPDHPIAYKTGTSYGFRDAWAAGFTPRFTVVVWTGRRDNAPLPGATGRDVAAPLLFRIFALLPREAPAQRPLDAAAARRPLAPRLSEMSPQPGLRMLFPPNDAALAFDPQTPIDLRAAGGTPPYRWTVDGIPLPAAAGALWKPDAPGFSHLSVTDCAGRVASADVKLVTE